MAISNPSTRLRLARNMPQWVVSINKIENNSMQNLLSAVYTAYFFTKLL